MNIRTLPKHLKKIMTPPNPPPPWIFNLWSALFMKVTNVLSKQLTYRDTCKLHCFRIPIVHGISQRFPTCGMPTTGGIQSGARWCTESWKYFFDQKYASFANIGEGMYKARTFRVRKPFVKLSFHFLPRSLLCL